MKLSSIKRALVDTKKHIKNFGLIYGTSFFFTKFIFRKHTYITRKRAIKILDIEFGKIPYECAKEINKTKIDDTQKNIFVFWAQGFSKAPFIVQESVKKIKHFYPDYNLILVDIKNYNSYVNLSDKIIGLFNKNKITIQTFSDILRFNLLYKYGGVRCDATILFFERINFIEQIKNKGFYSINHDSTEKNKLWGKVYPVTYTTFLFGTYKNSPIMHACVEFYNSFYNKYDFAIDYFMTDYILILCMKYKVDNDTLNNIPFINGNPFYLINSLKNNKIPNINECKKSPQKTNRRLPDLMLKIKEINDYEQK